jgi:putative transposase
LVSEGQSGVSGIVYVIRNGLQWKDAPAGYRRITALVNRERARAGKPAVNHKRVFRIMRLNSMLLARHTGRRSGRVHDGKIIVMRSNLRWCSDGFEIACWNGDPIRILHHRCP